MSSTDIDASATPSLRGLIEEIIEERMESVHGPQPGVIIDYDEGTQLATVQPIFRKVRIDEITGERVATDRPQVTDVPVCQFGGQGGRITTPISVGDHVLMVQCGVYLDRWILGNLAGPATIDPGPATIDPGNVDPRRHGGRVGDVIAIQGAFPIRNQPTTAPVDAVVIHGDNRLGGPDATELVAWHSALLDLKQAFDTWATVGGDGGAALKTLLTALINTGWPHGPTKTRAK